MTNAAGKEQPSQDLTPSLVLRLRRGEDDAASMLDALYRDALLRFAFGYLGNRIEAEDLVQDVFVRVLQSDLVPDDFRAWIYKITRNRCLDRLRRRGRQRDDQSLPGDSLIVESATGNLSQIVKKERRAHLLRVLATIPAAQREVLRLRYSEGLSRKEIAEILDLPESLVKSRLYEGLQNLRRHSSLS